MKTPTIINMLDGLNLPKKFSVRMHVLTQALVHTSSAGQSYPLEALPGDTFTKSLATGSAVERRICTCPYHLFVSTMSLKSTLSVIQRTLRSERKHVISE